MRFPPSKIQEVISILCMVLVVGAICLPLSVYESLEREVDRWIANFSTSSFQVILYPRKYIEYEKEVKKQAVEGMTLFAPPDIPLLGDDQSNSGEPKSIAYFTSRQLAEIRTLPDIQNVSWARPYWGDLSVGGQEFVVSLVSPGYFESVGLKILKGRTPDVQELSQVAVLGAEAAFMLFGSYEAAVGQHIVPDPGGFERELTVIGVLEPAGGAYERWKDDIDRAIYVLDREPIDISTSSTVRPTGLAITAIWVDPKLDRQREAIQEIQIYLQKEFGFNTVITVLTNREYSRRVGGISARQSYLPYTNWILGIIIVVAALNISIILYSLLVSKRYTFGIKRSLGVTRVRLFIEEGAYLLSQGMLATLIGILIVAILAPQLGVALQPQQSLPSIRVSLGIRTILVGFVVGTLIWCVVAFTTLFIFLKWSPSELLREKSKSFSSDRTGRWFCGLGLAISTVALLVILGLRDGTMAQFDRVLGWAGGERAGAIVDWITINTPSDEKPVELSPTDYSLLKKALPNITFGWLSRTGGLPEVKTLEASASMSTIRPPILMLGRWFNLEEEKERNQVTVLGYDLARQLVSERNVTVNELIGQKWQSYEIIGVMGEWPARYSMGYRSDIAYVPVGAKKIDAKYYFLGGQIAFIIPEAMERETFIEEIEHVLAEQHPEGKPQFIFAANSIGETLEWRMQLYSLMGAFAGFSFMIGGLGVTNILIIWIMAHLQEMGIRRACGARQTVIILQIISFAFKFTLNSILIGSAIGIITVVILQIQNEWPITVYPYWLAVSIGVTFVVIFIFSLLPLIWAAKQSPASLMRMNS